MKSKDGYLHILKYTGLFGGVQGMGILLNLVRNKFVALLLGPAGIGLISLYNTALNFVSQATNLGISFSAVRHLSELNDAGDKVHFARYVQVVRGWSLLTGLVGMLVFAILGPFVCSTLLKWGEHTLAFVMLSPIVFMTAITGGETAILKATRKLKPLALIQLISVVAALVSSLPLYYFFGMSGVVPVLIIVATVTTIFTLHASCQDYPYFFRGSLGVLGEGMEMVRLGVAFVMAGIFGSGAEMLIRTYLNANGNLDVVGLYNAGYMLTITYAGMVFSAMETDYFPRLSAVNHDIEAMNVTVNQQIEVSILLISPMLALLIVVLPVLLPLLYSRCFMDVVVMGQIAVFSMYFKAITLPIEYINLAKGASRSYLFLEALFDILMVVFVVYGYLLWGLWGTGFALSLAYFVNMLIVLGFVYWHYHYVLSRFVLICVIVQYGLGVLAYATTFLSVEWVRWVVGLSIVLISGCLSLYIIICKKTPIWNVLKKKLLHHD